MRRPVHCVCLVLCVTAAPSDWLIFGCESTMEHSDLEFNDLIRIGCRMQHQHAYPPLMSADGDVLAGAIMKEGERGNEMWIVADGVVRVERESESGKAVSQLPCNHSMFVPGCVLTRSLRLVLRSASASCASTKFWESWPSWSRSHLATRSLDSALHMHPHHACL